MSEATHGPGWSTETADFLDDLYARDDAEKAAAAEKLLLKEERKALRKRKLEERSANDATSASCGKGQTSTVRRELRSRTIPESTLLVEATPDAIDDVHSSKRRRSSADAVTPTDASEPYIDSNSVHPPTLLVDRPSTSPSACTSFSASKTAATDACQNSGTTRSGKGPCYFSTLPSGRRVCPACYTYERQHEKHRPPELEARLQSQIGLGGADADCSAHSASAATLASASKRTVVPIPTCSNCRAPTGSYGRPSALTSGWEVCGACKRYERRHKKHRPPELEAARQSRVAVKLGYVKRHGMEENSEATRGPGWSTETADYLDKLWARHEAEKAEADEKLQLKEERKRCENANWRNAVAMTYSPSRLSLYLSVGMRCLPRFKNPVEDLATSAPWPQAGGSARHATHTSDGTKNTAHPSLKLGSNRKSDSEAPTQIAAPILRALPLSLRPLGAQSF
ncbi:hypothetical protein B0H14DRAFT_3763364 [Mycena olivaceomarginata]|nr:hypothetical protein B0H14DRAFT_3763364 [Mycena olivaceomarginata]